MELNIYPQHCGQIYVNKLPKCVCCSQFINATCFRCSQCSDCCSCQVHCCSNLPNPQYEYEYGCGPPLLGGIICGHRGECNSDQRIMDYCSNANGNFHHTRCLFQCGRPLMPGYGGHVPGQKYHSAGKSYGNATRDACCVIGYRKQLYSRLPARVWEQ